MTRTTDLVQLTHNYARMVAGAVLDGVDHLSTINNIYGDANLPEPP